MYWWSCIGKGLRGLFSYNESFFKVKTIPVKYVIPWLIRFSLSPQTMHQYFQDSQSDLWDSPSAHLRIVHLSRDPGPIRLSHMPISHLVLPSPGQASIPLPTVSGKAWGSPTTELDSIQCAVHSVECAVQSVECAVHSVECAVHRVECSVQSVECAVHNIECAVHSVKCRVSRGLRTSPWPLSTGHSLPAKHLPAH